MKMRWHRLKLAIVVSVVASLAVGGRAEEGSFPVGVWYGPPARANRLETWQTIADAKFNVVGPCYGYSKDDNQAMLRFCERLGLKAIVVDSRIRPEMVAEPQWRKVLRETVADYQPYAGLLGYYVNDEPSARWFPVLGEIHAELKLRDPRRLPYVNLYPNYASPAQLASATHRDYLRRYVESVRPAIISYDHYPFLAAGEDRSDYFENLESIRSSADATRTPVWGIVQVTPHEHYRDPSAAELEWQVFTSLAYGVKGLSYFTYWPPPSLAESAIVDANGAPTDRYAMVKRLNQKIHAIGPTLLSLHSTAVYHTGAIPAGCTRLPSDALFRLPADRPLIVGCFESAEHEPFVMLVNRDYRESQEFEVELRNDVAAVWGVDADDGRVAEVTCEQNRFSLSLPPGQGRLFKMKTRSFSRGPFRPAKQIDFDFTDDDEDWVAAHSLSPPVAEQGKLRSNVTGEDPYFCHTFLAVPADRYRRILVNLRAPGKFAQFFWQTAEHLEFNDARHKSFATIGDDEFHEYVIDLQDHPGWKGQEIRAIRLDPTTSPFKPGQTVEIDYVRGE